MLIYIGKGAAIPDVPARDLTDEEIERCGGEVFLLKTKLYRKPPKIKSDKPEKPADAG